jgi:hypothetical protein
MASAYKAPCVETRFRPLGSHSPRRVQRQLLQAKGDDEALIGAACS